MVKTLLIWNAILILKIGLCKQMSKLITKKLLWFSITFLILILAKIETFFGYK